MATLDSDDRIYLEALLEPMKQAIARHERLLYGNGQVGLVQQVTQRDGTLGLHAERIDRLMHAEHTHGTRDRLTHGGIYGAVSAIVAGIVAGIGLLIHPHP